VLRPAYTLGGSGGGIAHNQPELKEILEKEDMPHHCKEEAQNILETELLEDENE